MNTIPGPTDPAGYIIGYDLDGSLKQKDYYGNIVVISGTANIPTLTSELTNDGADGVNQFISLADLPYQIEIYNDITLFPTVGNDDIVYLAENTGIFYLWDGTNLVYNQITSNAFPTGLERITEGTNTGWRLVGRNPANYGNIGNNAVDISTSLVASIVRGATGEFSFAQGRNTRAAATGAVALGDNTIATSQYAFAHGNDTQATNNGAEAGGTETIASGNSSVSKGLNTRARSTAEFSVGHFGTDYTPINSSSASNTTDRVFNIGNGLSSVARSNAFTVFKNGAVQFFVGDLANITNGVVGFFTFNSTDSNRPYIHNGSTWKGLAYTDEIPTKTSNFYLTGTTTDAQDNKSSSIWRDGSISVGTSSSSSTKLYIFSTQSGAFRLQDGTQANGYILTSDSNGVGTWTPLSSVGISGSASYLPKFTGTSSLGNSNFIDNGSSGVYSVGPDSVTFIPGANVFLRLLRSQSSMDFILGNPGSSQANIIQSINSFGFNLSSQGYLVLSSGPSYSEAMRITSTGDIGIGTSSPSTKLHVFATQSGAFRLQDGTQANGYILTSDSNGVGTWTASTTVAVITTTSSITTNTLDDSGFNQRGRCVIINNGTYSVNITVDATSGFSSTYLKHGTASISFVQGSGRTLVQVDGTLNLNGSVGSTATIISYGTTDYLRINNA